MTNFEKQADKCAKEIIDFLIKNELWGDINIYTPKGCYSNQDEKGHYHYEQDWSAVYYEAGRENYSVEYRGDGFLVMTFEGALHGVFNYNYSIKYCDEIIEEFNKIIEKYGRYYELGYSWSLALYKI